MLRGALIGVGHVARNGHLPGWRGRPDAAAVVAAADARTDGREALRAAFPQARWYDSAEELLSRERLDFVDVCTPPADHAPLARRALEAGCHVLCEKPLVLSPDALAPLAAAARDADRALVTVHNWKNAPALAKVSDLVRGDAIGPIRRARWETLRAQPAVAAGDDGNWRTDPARSGGGILVDHGWHALYVLREWLGGRPSAVSARLENHGAAAHAIEDTADVWLEWAGASCEIHLTWAAGRRGNRVLLEGERGTIELDGGRVCLRAARAAPAVFDLPSIAEGSHHPEWFDGVLDEFLREAGDPAIRGRNLEVASLCATLIAVAQESSRAGSARRVVPPR